jgi:RNA polymerase sigma-70 factor, ECF subfamily
MTMGSAAIASLAIRANRGDSAALNELLNELRPLVVRTTRLIVGSGSWAAEDAAQEALVDISRGISGLRDPTAVQTWAMRVATRRALKVARRERLLRLHMAPSHEGQHTASSHEGPHGSAPTKDRGAAIKQAFDRLPPRLRATAVLRLQAGLSENEAATALGCSIGAVKSNLHEARRRMTQSLTEAGYAPTVEQRKENLSGRE